MLYEIVSSSDWSHTYKQSPTDSAVSQLNTVISVAQIRLFLIHVQKFQVSYWFKAF
jgi:hypothetical protein